MIKKLLLIPFLFISMTSFSQEEILKNETVIQLVKLGLGTEVIINKINTSKVNFDLSVDHLIKLKELGISDSIVAAMIKQSSSSKPEADLSHESGIFMSFIDSNGKNIEKKLIPTAITGHKSKNLLGAAFSYGLSSVKTVAIIQNAFSSNQISVKKPDFIFYFKNSSQSLNNGFSLESNSPAEFVLIKLTIDGEQRIYQTGKASISGYSFGVSEKDMLIFEVEKIDDSTFKVSVPADLAIGEYAFIPKISGSTSGNLVKIYDFGIID